MPKTLAPPPDDKAMWRKVLARCHPDAGGDHEAERRRVEMWEGSVREYNRRRAEEHRQLWVEFHRSQIARHRATFDALISRHQERLDALLAEEESA